MPLSTSVLVAFLREFYEIFEGLRSVLCSFSSLLLRDVGVDKEALEDCIRGDGEDTDEDCSNGVGDKEYNY